MEPANGAESHLQTHHLPSPLLTPVEEELPKLDSPEPFQPEIKQPKEKHTLNGTLSSAESNATQAVKKSHHGRDRSSSFPFRSLQSPEQLDGHTPSRRATLTPLDLNVTSKSESLKLSPSQIYDLTTAPGSIPLRAAPPKSRKDPTTPVAFPPVPHTATGAPDQTFRDSTAIVDDDLHIAEYQASQQSRNRDHASSFHKEDAAHRRHAERPKPLPRSYSTPSEPRRRATHSASNETRTSTHSSTQRAASKIDEESSRSSSTRPAASKSDPLGAVLDATSLAQTLPLPPFSLPTHLQLELADQPPSPLYIFQPHSTYAAYESFHVKFQRLLNFLILPPQLERVLLFGALACLDAWLYLFTVLPLRFCKSLWMLLTWLSNNATEEVRDVSRYMYDGVWRLWGRYRHNASVPTPLPSPKPQPPRIDTSVGGVDSVNTSAKHTVQTRHHHRRISSTPSQLRQCHKADLIQGCLIITSTLILVRFDASRIYHNIRGQSAIKLYVIYNMLEVFDKLFAALGQDILECLFSKEMLERDSYGRSKILQPFWMFLLASVYCVLHATGLFYQVVTLNVAVNSYSNALLTLLMSNQFVEIKGSVFKKIEKENLFQLTCADVVERFQLWLMLLIIGLRNIVEVNSGSLFSSPFSSGSSGGGSGSSMPSNSNNTATSTSGATSTFSILPMAFTLLPESLRLPQLGPVVQVLSPFAIVLASEMLVDWIKHAYITKFNAVAPRIYSRFLDVLAKDYYTHAFHPQPNTGNGNGGLTRRLGLPAIPLACLFIRSALQTYHMFLATNISAPTLSTSTGLSVESQQSERAEPSPIFAQLDYIFRRALGQSSFGGGNSGTAWTWTLDDGIALMTMLVFFLVLYLLLLAVKLALGMILLTFARERYNGMSRRERDDVNEPGTKRHGGWGVTEVGDERREKIYEGDAEGLDYVRRREKRGADSTKSTGTQGLSRVDRYAMVAKRIW